MLLSFTFKIAINYFLVIIFFYLFSLIRFFSIFSFIDIFIGTFISELGRMKIYPFIVMVTICILMISEMLVPSSSKFALWIILLGSL